MTKVAVYHESADPGSMPYRASSGRNQAMGRTAGEALDLDGAMSREKLRAIGSNNNRETVGGRINRTDPLELLGRGPMVLRNGRRIIADTTHPASSRPLSPPGTDSRPLIRPRP